MSSLKTAETEKKMKSKRKAKETDENAPDAKTKKPCIKKEKSKEIQETKETKKVKKGRKPTATPAETKESTTEDVKGNVDTAIETEAMIEDAPEGEGATKRKRTSASARPKKTPLELRNEASPDIFVMKKKINYAQMTFDKFHIPKGLRKPLRSIVSHKTELEDGELKSEIEQLYKAAIDHECVVFMANCLIYYENHHGIQLKKKDAQLIERAIERPKRVPYDKLFEIYTLYTCGMEEQHKYYSKFCKIGEETTPKTKRVRPNKEDKPVKHLPYNLFIKESWRLRKDEFNRITADLGISDVMRKLSTEWKADPAVKEKYKIMADTLNQKETPTDTNPPLESAI